MTPDEKYRDRIAFAQAYNCAVAWYKGKDEKELEKWQAYFYGKLSQPTPRQKLEEVSSERKENAKTAAELDTEQLI